MLGGVSAWKWRWVPMAFRALLSQWQGFWATAKAHTAREKRRLSANQLGGGIGLWKPWVWAYENGGKLVSFSIWEASGQAKEKEEGPPDQEKCRLWANQYSSSHCNKKVKGGKDGAEPRRERSRAASLMWWHRGKGTMGKWAEKGRILWESDF